MNKQKKGAPPSKKSAYKYTDKIANSQNLDNAFLIGYALGIIHEQETRQRLITNFLDPLIQESMNYFELSSFMDGLTKATILGRHHE